MKKILTGILAVGLAPSLVGALASCAPTSSNELAKVSNKANYNEEEYLQLRVTNRPGQTWCDFKDNQDPEHEGRIKTPDEISDEGYQFTLVTQEANVATTINLYTWSGEIFCKLSPIKIIYVPEPQHGVNYAHSMYKLTKNDIEKLWEKCPSYSEISIVPQFSEKEVKLVSLNPFVSTYSEQTPECGKEFEFDVLVPQSICTIDPTTIQVWCGDKLLRPRGAAGEAYDYEFTFNEAQPHTGHFKILSMASDFQAVITDNIKFYVGTKTQANEHEFKITINNLLAPCEPMSLAIDSPSQEFEMDVPSFIEEHKRHALSATWHIQNGDEIIKSGSFTVNEGKISGTFEDCDEYSSEYQIVLNIGISTSSESDQNTFQSDSWTNFVYWLNFANHDLNWFANLYHIDGGKEGLIGQKRTVIWDTVPHTVVVRGLQNYEISTPQDDHWADPVGTGEYADLTFMFDNLLTYRNGDSVRIKFKTSGFDDTGDNAWIQQYGDREDGDTKNTSYARDFVNSKKDFLNKFAADGFLDAVKGITHDRIGDGVDADNWEDYTWSYWDKFFIPSATELGGTASFYGRETADGEDSFVQFLPEVDDDDACEDRMFSPVGSDSCEKYWTASPSPRGSGFLKTEDMAYVTDNGKIDNCDMDEHKALLIMFCI